MLVATACGDLSNEAESIGEGEDITVEFWTMKLEATFTDYLEDFIDRYEEENSNVTIDGVDVLEDDLEQKVLFDINIGNAPDVVNLNTSFGVSLAELDATTNIDEFVSDEERDQYLEGAWEANQYNDETFGIPWYLDTDVTLSNEEIFEEAGLYIDDPPET